MRSIGVQANRAPVSRRDSSRTRQVSASSVGDGRVSIQPAGPSVIGSSVWAPEGGGANIGMGLLAPVCFLVGLVGMVLAVAATVSGQRERRRAGAAQRR